MSWFRRIEDELHLDTILSAFSVTYNKLHDYVAHKNSLMAENDAQVEESSMKHLELSKKVELENQDHAASIEKASKAISGLKNILG